MENSIYSGHTHSFDTGIASELGITAAVVFNHIVGWLRWNASKKDIELREGKVWMYETQKQIADSIGYLSEDEVQRDIKKLVESGLLLKGNHNKNAFDRTNWYTVKDQELISIKAKIKKISPIPPDDGIQIPQNDGIRNREPADCIYEHVSKHVEKTTTAAPPSTPVVVFSCLDNLDIPKDLKEKLSKSCSKETLENVMKAYEQQKENIKDIEAWIVSACKKQWKPKPSKEKVFEKNKKTAQEFLENATLPKDTRFEILNKHVEFSYGIGQPHIIPYSIPSNTLFTNALIKKIHEFRILTRKKYKTGDEK